MQELMVSHELHMRMSQDVTLMRISYGLHDAYQDIRCLSVEVIGILSQMNKAIALSALSSLLTEVLHDLNYKGDIMTTDIIIRSNLHLITLSFIQFKIRQF